KYRQDGTVSSTTISFDVDGTKRASQVGSDDVLTLTVEYRGGTPNDDDVSGLALRTKTYFAGQVAGEEKVDYTQKYRQDGTVSSTTISFYVDGTKRASQVGSDDVLTLTVEYRGGTPNDDDVSGLALRTKTY